MIIVNHILHPTDFSQSAEQALGIAIDLAVRAEARLTLLHVATDEPSGVDAREYFHSQLSESAASRLHDLSEASPQVLKVDYVSIGSASTAEAVVEFADTNDVDLIAIGTRGHGRLWHMLLGGVAESVIRESGCSVIVARKEDRSAPHTTQQIVVAVDFSPSSKPVVEQARHIAHTFGATLNLVFVAEEHMVPIFSDTGIPSVTRMKVDPEITKLAGDGLRQLYLETEGPEVPVTFSVLEGRPADEIVEFAESSGAGLIIMSTKGHTEETRGLLGSIPERVIRTSPCPVWAVKA